MDSTFYWEWLLQLEGCGHAANLGNQKDGSMGFHIKSLKWGKRIQLRLMLWKQQKVGMKVGMMIGVMRLGKLNHRAEGQRVMQLRQMDSHLGLLIEMAGKTTGMFRNWIESMVPLYVLELVEKSRTLRIEEEIIHVEN